MILGKSAFGINGITGLGVSAPLLDSYNPAVLPRAISALDQDMSLEAGYSFMDFSGGPQIINNWQTAVFRLRNNEALRIARYGIDSDYRSTRLYGDNVQLKFSGEAYEFSYAAKMNPKWDFGFSYIISERIETSVSQNGSLGRILLARGVADSDLHLRMGLAHEAAKNLNLGYVYTEDEIEVDLVLLPAYTGCEKPVSVNYDYTQWLQTLGVSWQPWQTTTISGAWQKGSCRKNIIQSPGPFQDFNIDLYEVSARQDLGADWSLELGACDNSWQYGVDFHKGDWRAGFGLAQNKFQRTSDYFGTADTLSLYFGKSW